VACFATDRESGQHYLQLHRARILNRFPSLRRRVISSLAGTTAAADCAAEQYRDSGDDEQPARTAAVGPSPVRSSTSALFGATTTRRTRIRKFYIAVPARQRADDDDHRYQYALPPVRTSLRQVEGTITASRTDDILVIKAPTTTFRPDFDQSIIARAMEEDPERAAAEYGAEWRRDLADYVNRETAEAAVVRDRRVLEPMSGIEYAAFCDPSGGLD